MSRFLLLSFAFLLACTPASSPNQALERLNREFAHRDANDFFLDYGSPAGTQTTQAGGKIYRWVSMEPVNNSRSAEAFVAGRRYDIADDTTNGETVIGYCEARILTDANNKIENISLVNDSIGKFGGSRCAEIFGQDQN